MLAGGADEEGGVDFGACSAARDILSRSMRCIGRYWRGNEGRVDEGRVGKRSR